MHIVILIYSFGAGGAERVTSLLLEELIKEYKITLVLLEDVCHYEIPNGVEKIILGKNSNNENGVIKLLKLPLLAYKYSKIIKDSTHSLSLMIRPNYINILASFFVRQPRIFISERCYPSEQYGYNNLASKINRFLIKALYNKAYKISANSEQNADDLVENFGIAREKVTFLPNVFCIDKIRNLSQEETELKQIIKRHKSNGEIIFVSVGRLDIGKNHILLINAFNEILSLGYKVHLFIIGSGELESYLKEAIGDSKNITLLGKTKNPYAPLSVADFFVFGSNHEGFPNVLVESISLGVPIITTDCAPRIILGKKRQDIDSMSLFKCGIVTPINNLNSMVVAIKLALDNPNMFHKDELLEYSMEFDIYKKIGEYKQWLEI